MFFSKLLIFVAYCIGFNSFKLVDAYSPEYSKKEVVETSTTRKMDEVKALHVGEIGFKVDKENYTYEFVFLTSTWNEAAEFCKSCGAQLVTIDNAEEKQLIKKCMRNEKWSLTGNLNVVSVWIGVRQPNNRCQVLEIDTGEIVKDIYCIQRFSYVCKKKNT